MGYLDDFGTEPQEAEETPLWKQALNSIRIQSPAGFGSLGLGPVPVAKQEEDRKALQENNQTTTEGPILTINIDTTLAERGNRYGPFLQHATATQDIKSAMVGTPNWSELAADQKEALEMIAHKIGRILCGDPNYHDSWWDLIGYAKLVADRLEKEQKA